MSTIASVAEVRRTRVRLFIVTMLFLVTTVNYADRATLSIAGPALSKDLGLNPVALGYVFSAFGWSYVIAQVPGGWLLDRFGSRWVYATSILVWSVFTMLQGWIGFLSGGAAIATLFALRFLVGFAEAPSFPANARVVAAWFPSNERGTASAFFNSGQYFATVIFAPLMGWIAHEFGWRHVFTVMGALGLVMGAIWIKTMFEPKEHPVDQRSRARLYPRRRRAGRSRQPAKLLRTSSGPKWSHIRQLLAEPDDARRLYRPVLHQHADLFLPDLVPGLSRQAARAVDPAGRLRCLRCRRCAASSAACSAASSPTQSYARPAR